MNSSKVFARGVQLFARPPRNVPNVGRRFSAACRQSRQHPWRIAGIAGAGTILSFVVYGFPSDFKAYAYSKRRVSTKTVYLYVYIYIYKYREIGGKPILGAFISQLSPRVRGIWPVSFTVSMRLTRDDRVPSRTRPVCRPDIVSAE